MLFSCACSQSGRLICRKPLLQALTPGSRQSRQSSHAACKTSRRDVTITFTTGLAAFTAAIIIPNGAAEARGLGTYLKKKALDPLDSYVAPLISAKKELKSSAELAETDVKEARSMLRSGALSGYRMNVRAVGEYAERLETATDPKKLVDTAIRNLEEFDSSLLLLSRGESSQDEAKHLLQTTLAAIDNLLESVPQEVMNDVTGIKPTQGASESGD